MSEPNPNVTASRLAPEGATRDAAHEALSVGDVVGGSYEITGLLGRGGMGVVYEARHLRLPGRRAAIKVLLAQVTWESEVVARFRREAEIASRLGHPHIVEVFDFDRLPSGAPYLVMEYLDGESLAARLQRGPIPVDEALLIARQVAAALHAAHREGIVHRDLKPENILLCQRELAGTSTLHVKVLDFGISKIQGSQTVVTQEAVLIGTPQYMAPEQALGNNRELDARTDQFALATIVYELLCGEPAFVGDNLAQLVFKIVYEPAPPLASRVPGLAPTLVAAVERGMRKAPAERFADVSELIAALTGQPLATASRSAVRAAEEGAGSRALGASSSGGASDGDPLGATVSAPSLPPPSGFERTLPRAAAPPVVAAKSQEAVPGALVPLAAIRPSRRRWLLLGAASLGLLWLLSSTFRGAGPSSTSRAPVPSANGRSPKAAPGSTSARPRERASDVRAAAPVEASVRDAIKSEGGSANPADEKSPIAKSPTALAPRPAVAKPAAAPAPKPLAPDVVSLMADAQRALDGGHPSDAIAIVQRALRVQNAPQLYALLVAAYCRSGDLGNAQAYLARVPAGSHRPLVARCLKDGVDLTP